MWWLSFSYARFLRLFFDFVFPGKLLINSREIPPIKNNEKKNKILLLVNFSTLAMVVQARRGLRDVQNSCDSCFQEKERNINIFLRVIAIKFERF